MYCISDFDILSSVRQSYLDCCDTHASSKNPESLSCQEATVGTVCKFSAERDQLKYCSVTYYKDRHFCFPPS